MRLIIREAHKHGVRHGLPPQPPRGIPAVECARPFAAHCFKPEFPPRVPCKHCNETDHAPEDCALAPTVPAVRPSQRETAPPVMRPPKRPLPQSAASPSLKKICISWNRGQCVVPGACTYRHSTGPGIAPVLPRTPCTNSL
jgi:hypothetical protein